MHNQPGLLDCLGVKIIAFQLATEALAQATGEPALDLQIRHLAEALRRYKEMSPDELADLLTDALKADGEANDA